jgi:hypothetical protein
VPLTLLLSDDLFSARSESRIGPMIYNMVFCEDPPPALSASAGIIGALLKTLPFFEPECPHPAVTWLEALRDRTYVTAAGRFYVLPDRLQDLRAPLIPILIAVHRIACRSPSPGWAAVGRLLPGPGSAPHAARPTSRTTSDLFGAGNRPGRGDPAPR